MYEDGEEIYDDTNEVMAESTGLSAIRSRFEDAQKQFGTTPSTGPKPVTSPKPKALPKYGGGTGLNICYASEKKDVNIPNALKCRNEGNTDNDSNGAVQKRDSKVNIPGAFLKNKDAPPVEHQPKPGTKPSKGDTNNNANVNGITSERFNKLETVLAQKKPGIVGRKPSNSETSATGNVSPRGKYSDASIPIDSGPSVGSAKSKYPRGNDTGIGILAQVAVMSGDSNTPVDLKSRLKHVDTGTTKNNTKPTVSPKKFAFDITSTDQKDVPWRKNLRSAKSRESTTQIQSVIRMFDGKKFHRVKNSSLGEDNAPDKPDRLDFDIDIDALELDYNEAIEHIDKREQKAHGWTEVIEDIDEDGNLCPISKRAVSLIQPMTEDEEIREVKWNQAGFNGLHDSTNDLPPPPTELLEEQETYDDVAVVQPAPPDVDLEEDEMYEELPEEGLPPPPVGPKPSDKPPEVPSTPLPKSPHVDKSEPEITPEPTPDNSKEHKRLEKERKKKEKEEKKLLEKKEKELKNLLKVLGVKAEVLTSTVGKGKVKSNAKGKKAGDLTVSEGEQVDIIRMIDNPAGKWLIRINSSQKVGYCDEKNVEVDTSSILNHKDTGAEFMTGSGGPKSSTCSTAGEEEQETYEAVDGEDELIEDEIYEECN